MANSTLDLPPGFELEEDSQNQAPRKVNLPPGFEIEDNVDLGREKGYQAPIMKAKKDQAIAQQQEMMRAKKQQMDEDPSNWSSERFKKEGPKPKTIEEAAKYDAILRQKKMTEKSMSHSLVFPEEGSKNLPPGFEVQEPIADRAVSHFPEKMRKDILDVLTRKTGKIFGIPESVPVPSPDEMARSGNPTMAGIAQTGRDLTAIPSEFVNQFFMNYPKSIARKAGYDLPEAQSTAGRVAQIAAGITGAAKNPVLKSLGVRPGMGMAEKMAKGAASFAAFAPSEDPVGLKQRTGQAAIGAVLPVGESVIAKTLESVSPALKSGAVRIINSLIKPLLKDLSYGKNPGRAIAAEKITANDLDELGQKIGQRLSDVGLRIRQTLIGKSNERVDLRNSMAPIDQAIKKAASSPRTNASLIKRLNDLKLDLLSAQTDEAGNIISQRNLIDLTPEEALDVKQQVGDLTKFTGNHSDDTMVNKALKMAYGVIKSRINQAVPEVKELNERYADLLSAKIATQYRDKIMQRQSLISFSDTEAGLGSALVSAVVSGGKAIPAILAGAGTVAIKKALQDPAVKTRVASGMMKLSESELTNLLKQYPKLQEFAWEVLRKLQKI